MSSRPMFHPWVRATSDPETHTRTLTAPEYVLALVNEHAQGHACPYLGVTVSVDSTDQSWLSAEALCSSLRIAFGATRWKHPVLAAQVKDQNHLVYTTQDAIGVATWTHRTVSWSTHSRGWPDKFAELSRGLVLPTAEGDCAMLYLVLHPDHDKQSPVTRFDLLLHVHHTLVDGAGLRSLMQAILQNFAAPVDLASYPWGEEAQRLDPAAIDVSILDDEAINSLIKIPKEVMIPSLNPPGGSRPGTGMVTYTFENDQVLNRLRHIARASGVKLTATLQAALTSALYAELKRGEDDFASIISGFDLRKRNLADPWGKPNKFVSAAIGLEMMQVPVSLLEDVKGDEETRFWEIAKHIQRDWDLVAQRANVSAIGESRRPATGLILQRALIEVQKSPAESGLSFNYTSDPPGSEQLDPTYPSTDGSTYVLERYQIITEESTPKLSCRSHSWNDRLTLAISFNNRHYQAESVQLILEKWLGFVESLV